MSPSKSAVALLLGSIVLSGCGDSKDNGAATQTQAAPAVQAADQRAILATIDTLQAASHAGDGLRICHDVFTTTLVRSIQKSSKRSCAAEVRRNLFKRDETIAVQRGIQVTGDTARAVVREQNGNVSTLHFVKQGGGWRIDRVIPVKSGSSP